MDKAAVLAKKALLRPIGTHHVQEHLKDLEQTLLKNNQLGSAPRIGRKYHSARRACEVFATSYCRAACSGQHQLSRCAAWRNHHMIGD